VKVSELVGRDLDYWVMRADGAKPIARPHHWTCQGTKALVQGDGEDADVWCVSCQLPSYTEHWDSNGLKLIERERIHLMPHRGPPNTDALENWWYAEALGHWFQDVEMAGVPITADGPTLLIAAMRCFVKSRFGEEVPSE
jgi:hypothetical protein